MRRFIAGAVCGECRALDRTVVEVVAGVRYRRCVSCGCSEQESEPTLPEPPNRFTRAAAVSVTASEAVRWAASPVSIRSSADPHTQDSKGVSRKDG